MDAIPRIDLGGDPCTLQYASDLHVEFDAATDEAALQALPHPCAPVLLLAGDVAVTQAGLARVFAAAARHWRAVLYVAGNHEAYGSTVAKSIAAAREAAAPHANVHVLQQGAVDLVCGPRTLRVAGATLWTRVPPSEAGVVESAVNDYKRIGVVVDGRWRRARVRDITALHDADVAWLARTLRESPHHTLVVTHHLPSHVGIAPQWEGNPLNVAYATELPRELLGARTLVGWVCGHTHTPIVGARLPHSSFARLFANPRGYPPERAAAAKAAADDDARAPLYADTARLAIAWDADDAVGVHRVQGPSLGRPPTAVPHTAVASHASLPPDEAVEWV